MTQQHPQTLKLPPKLAATTRPRHTPQNLSATSKPTNTPKPRGTPETCQQSPKSSKNRQTQKHPKPGTFSQTRQHPPKLTALPAPAGRSRPEPSGLRPCHTGNGGRSREPGAAQVWRQPHHQPGCTTAAPRDRLRCWARLPSLGQGVPWGMAALRPQVGKSCLRGVGKGQRLWVQMGLRGVRVNIPPGESAALE